MGQYLGQATLLLFSYGFSTALRLAFIFWLHALQNRCGCKLSLFLLPLEQYFPSFGNIFSQLKVSPRRHVPIYGNHVGSTTRLPSRKKG
jgi:hypothetical protein